MRSVKRTDLTHVRHALSDRHLVVTTVTLPRCLFTLSRFQAVCVYRIRQLLPRFRKYKGVFLFTLKVRESI